MTAADTLLRLDMLRAAARRKMLRTRRPLDRGPCQELPSPVAARIATSDRGVVLEYLGVADRVLVEHAHGSLASAKAQALADLGILDDDWR